MSSFGYKPLSGDTEQHPNLLNKILNILIKIHIHI